MSTEPAPLFMKNDGKQDDYNDATWQRFTGKAKSMWGDLTDDDLLKYRGKYDEAMGYLKQRYTEKTDDFATWWKGESDKDTKTA